MITIKSKYYFFIYGKGVYVSSITGPVTLNLEYKLDYSTGASLGKILTSYDNGKYLIILNLKRFFIVEVELGENSLKRKVLGIKTKNPEDVWKDLVVFRQFIYVLSKFNKLKVIRIGMVQRKFNQEKLAELDVQGIERRQEEGNSLAICSSGKYLFVSQRDKNQKSSNISVFEVILNANNSSLEVILRTVLDTQSLGINELYSFIFVKYFGELPALCALPFGGKGNNYFYTFMYDPEEDELKEVEPLRKDIGSSVSIAKLVSFFSGKIVGITSKSDILTLKYD